MKSALELFRDLLNQNSPYRKVTLSEDQEPSDLGPSEYTEVVKGNKAIICFGQGRLGDSGCSINFTFDLQTGHLICHGAIYEGEE